MLVLTSLGAGAVGAVEPTDSPNRLDQPIVDLALLEPAGPDGAPRLLVIDAIPPADGVVRLRILQREEAWGQASSLDVQPDAVAGSSATPWLIGLGATDFALILPSAATGSTQVVTLRTDGGDGGRELRETARTTIGNLVDVGGAADVDADGIPELVLGSVGTGGLGQACEGSTLAVLDRGTLAVRRMIHVHGQRLRGGVIGRWDAVAGDDLLAYADDRCPADPETTASPRLAAIRLDDGERIETGIEAVSGDGLPLGAPLRFDGSGGLDSAVVRGTYGLTIVDPGRDWATTVIGAAGTLPLSVGPAGETVDGVPRTRLAWIDFEHDALAVIADLVRAADGAPVVGAVDSLPVAGMQPNRVRWLAAEAVAGMRAGRPAATWTGPVRDAACLDLLVPGARLGCDDQSISGGAAWIGTRPVGVLGADNERRLLVASGMTAEPGTGLPQTPSPWAAAPLGWWRQGPSAAFALAELRAGDAVYYRDFPVPRSSVERVTAPDASTVVPGFTGVRLLVHATGVPADREVAVRDTLAERVLEGGDPNDLLTVVRIPVPPGLDAGRDGASIRVPLSRASLADGTPADQWAVQVVPVNDWGEVGDVATGAIQRDGTGPTLVMGVPFTTPVWPLPARLTGTAEPDATVVVDGIGPVELGRRGEFAFQTTLAPWPQTLRVVATDPSGNRTVRELSVIGGVDYRQFPWTVILAFVVLGVVAVSGFVGTRRRPAGGALGVPGAAGSGGSRTSWLTLDDGLTAEIEDLPPGAGLPPR